MSKLCPIYKVLIAVGVFAMTVEARAQGRPIEFSKPRDASANADLTQPTQDSAPIEDPYRMPDSLMPQSSLQGFKADAPPQPEQTQQPLTARQRALLEKKKNWAFVNPEDTISGVTEDDIFNLKDIKAIENPDLNLSPIEQYYEKEFEKKKPNDLERDQFKQAEQQPGKDDGKNSREKSMRDLLMGEIKDHTQAFQPNDDLTPPKKANDDAVSSFQTTDPFSSANYGPNAPATAQQARMDVFKKLYGLTDDSDAKKTAPVSSPVAITDTKPKPDDAFQSFYGQKSPPPMVGSIAPVAPIAPGKPSLEPVSAPKPVNTYEKNPLFTSPTMVLPRRPFQ